MNMSKGKQKETQVKKINCSSLPPCEKVLDLHLQRANYIALMWRRAHTEQPTKGLHPLNYGWVANDDGLYVPCWFQGKTLTASLASEDIETQQELDEASEVQLREEITDNVTDFDDTELDEIPWSDDSESELEDNHDDLI